MGSGAHGHVFALVDQPTKVIKVAWAPAATQYSPSSSWVFDRVQETYQYLLRHQISILAQVEQFDPLLLEGDRQYYAVVMERLLSLTEDENKVMKSVCMDYNGQIAEGTAIKHLQELHQWLSFDKEKALEFYRAVSDLPIVHRDFHRRNIMKDASGNFKLIDFELLVIKENDNETN